MPPPSLARDFYKQIVESPDPVAFIQGLVNPASPVFETDWLDFKQQPNANLKDAKWREMWIQALSGFANNQGGVLVWGIDARKDPGTNIDAACGVKAVDNPQGVKSRLTELQRQATDPPLGNVEIEAYEIPSAPGKGFVICLIPDGPFKPYRAEEGPRSQYWIRSGDNFVVLSRPMLQAMFYPHAKAVFRARAVLSWELVDRVGQQATSPRNTARFRCETGLVNDGTATARNTLIVVKAEVEGNLEQLGWTSDLWRTHSWPDGQEFEAPRPLHPGRVTPLFRAQWEVEARSSIAADHKVVPSCPAPSFSLAVYCENQERQVMKLEFDMQELIENRRCFHEARPVE
jgi:hypothetical protein